LGNTRIGRTGWSAPGGRRNLPPPSSDRGRRPAPAAPPWD